MGEHNLIRDNPKLWLEWAYAVVCRDVQAGDNG